MLSHAAGLLLRLRRLPVNSALIHHRTLCSIPMANGRSGSEGNTLSHFLAQHKKAYLAAIEEGKGDDWTVVMGNEAGDLDSIASATPRRDLHLRVENLHALSLAGLADPASPDYLLCIDDLPPSARFPSTRFALVDHNRLQPRFQRDNPGARVVAVIDHHQDEGLYRDSAEPRIIVVPTGSCSSLVARLLEENQGGKAEEPDRRAAAFLIPLSSLSSSADLSSTSPGSVAGEAYDIPGIRDLDTVLQDKKVSVAHLGTLDLLRRDYKEYTMTPSGSSAAPEILVGLSSVPIGFHDWIPRHADFWSATERWMAERGLTVLGVLTSFRDTRKPGKNGKGKHRREQLYVVRGDEALAERLFGELEENDELKLKRRKFKDYDVADGTGFGGECKSRVWKQKNVDATRKVTAPIVKSIIEGPSRNANL
ncbi:Exopolyphosphatase [Grifola frondosa]|uniref:Exopolyphosphatase n=1 Tax=Grifola frondosa TaxID=5627 RepID=A0A1C7MIY1_GRIFR|nr:Exopolyphosphatase [Grifola frondosa]